MRKFLILKLQAPMQCWGEHTFEGLRPSANLPSRSGILGLIGSCLGIKRNDQKQLQELADSVGMAVRVDTRCLTGKNGSFKTLRIVKTTDYHTVLDARADYEGKKQPHKTIQTWREYLYDGEFTVSLWNHNHARISLDQLEASVKRPVFTPYLGRRCCPLARPLFLERLQAMNSVDALKGIPPSGGTIYSEEKIDSKNVRMKRVRDVPLVQQPRQFAGRNLYIYGGEYVSD
ncbi:MAG: type I-E CRISPR-associated protein Cas5/CasD [Desulfobacterales bacterium]|nr:type I-E CRISPR-associated protein Cas5/CasD [Desulfobacterales bacterium]MDD4072737.1 type I-E CRISPR-associated protein Cas5/CasD [Desulfobacterales bacterium]MDD4392374.1 type I-E CRISPR-associated protein Cas5/CasD [Desulfobacterales bacterium]